VARARGMSPQQVRDLVYRHIEKPLGGLVAESRVNVLELNLDLDGMR
jgi:potassium-transporting ATPase KdpC subunit